MKINPLFTKDHKGHPYFDQEYETRQSEIKDFSGSAIFKQDNVKVPKTWSKIATDIIAQKYFRKTGVPKDIDPTASNLPHGPELGFLTIFALPITFHIPLSKRSDPKCIIETTLLDNISLISNTLSDLLSNNAQVEEP